MRAWGTVIALNSPLVAVSAAVPASLALRAPPAVPLLTLAATRPAAQIVPAVSLASLGQVDPAARPGDDLLREAAPANTRSAEASALKYWDSFRSSTGAARYLAPELDPSAVEDVLCMFLLALVATMKPRRKASAAVQPKSAAAVIEHVRRVHTRDGHKLPPTPRVAALVKALEVRISKVHGPGALLPDKKAPMTLEILLYARVAAEGRTIAGRVVLWSEPFWTCIWAAIILLWYAGARKSDVLTTKGTPFDRRRISRASISFHARGATGRAGRRPPPISPADGATVRVQIAGSKTDQTGVLYADSDVVLADDGDSGPANGARALRLFVAACPPDAAVALCDQPLFSVPGCEPITGELLDGILTAMLAASLGSDAPRYSLHSMRSGAATALRNAGYSDSEICRAFRWASMPCMQGYARTDTAARIDITRALAEQAPATRVSGRARVSTALALAAQSG
jgi:hypothetical protein